MAAESYTPLGESHLLLAGSANSEVAFELEKPQAKGETS